ncbi:MAG: hypothetical protein ACRD0P_12585 [Stackebrandtia sp.]
MEVIVYPDTEALLVDHLASELDARGDTATVHTAIPHPRPDKFVTLTRLGGVKPSIITDAAQIGVECWAATGKQAHGLAQQARGLLHALPGAILDGHTVYRIDEWAGPANLPDPVSDQSRYTFQLSVHIRGTAA